MSRIIVWLSRLLLTGVVLAVAGLVGLVWLVNRVGTELPDYQRLAEYTPPTVTRVHAGDGRLLAEYARERRIFVPIDAIPARLKEAFVAAEDQNFYHHFGLDPVGIAGAVVDNVRRLQENRRPRGASTITQQVAKNFLVGDELSLSRKFKEAILAIRIDRAFTKDHILELYLNEIYLGNRSFGVAAAALNYFDKSLDQLSIGEAAFLAALPKAPSRFDAAVDRRAYVLGRMVEDGYITDAEAQIARAEPVTLRRRSSDETVVADFFTEEVRRQLVAKYGEEGFYEGGLSVRTTVQPKMQELADRALRDGLFDYDRKRGWRGPVAQLEPGAADWQEQLAKVDPGFELGRWRLAMVTGTDARGVALGFADGGDGRMALGDLRWARRAEAEGRLGPQVKQSSDVVQAGDVVLVEAGKDGWQLRQRPQVEGALVALDPHTGQVLAMSGGFSYRQSQFNRATQAYRQPGSAFKPFVYLAALEHGFTPASIVLDAPIVIDQGPGLPKWRPENYSQQFYGPSTLRLGLEKSRNLMTVRLAQEIGMESVIDLARRFHIARGLQPFLASALGSNEVTALSLTTAYAMIVNGGHGIEPYLVERIQDRNGRTIMRRDSRDCAHCQDQGWHGQDAPDLADTRPEVTDPRLAYQMVSMLEGVVERGTAAAARSIGRPLAGKTGTSNDAKDAWFVGFSPDLVAGVFIGFDQPESMGGRETGGSVALPVWIEFMKGALEGMPPQPFRTPAGLQLVLVDAETGLLPGNGTRVTIPEAFLPGTEPLRSRGSGTAGGGSPSSSGGLY